MKCFVEELEGENTVDLQKGKGRVDRYLSKINK